MELTEEQLGGSAGPSRTVTPSTPEATVRSPGSSTASSSQWTTATASCNSPPEVKPCSVRLSVIKKSLLPALPSGGDAPHHQEEGGGGGEVDPLLIRTDLFSPPAESLLSGGGGKGPKRVCCLMPWCRPPLKGVSKHVLPSKEKDPLRRMAWLKACNVKESQLPSSNARVCSLHFRKEDYETGDNLYEKFGMKKVPRLKRTAVPSGTPLAPESARERGRRERREKRERRRMVKELLASAVAAAGRKDPQPGGDAAPPAGPPPRGLLLPTIPLPPSNVKVGVGVGVGVGVASKEVVPDHAAYTRLPGRKIAASTQTVAQTGMPRNKSSQTEERKNKKQQQSQTDPDPLLVDNWDLRHRKWKVMQALNRERRKNEKLKKRSGMPEKERVRIAKEVIMERTPWSEAQVGNFLGLKPASGWARSDVEVACLVRQLTSHRAYTFLRSRRLVSLPAPSTIRPHWKRILNPGESKHVEGEEAAVEARDGDSPLEEEEEKDDGKADEGDNVVQGGAEEAGGGEPHDDMELPSLMEEL